MGRVRYTKRAREDMRDIWLQVARRRSESVADKIVERIEERSRQLNDHPQLGRVRPEIAEGARALVAGRWLLLYRLTPDGVQIVRIVDGARDLRRIAEITAPFPSWPGLSRPSTSWIINTLVYYRNLIQRRGEFYANHPIYLN